ncbi:MAG TPA: hypothetical protein VFT72_06430 [Opitutaceae bacterium]|nr:hypothetical protein [Opitutaceae bacterium]
MMRVLGFGILPPELRHGPVGYAERGKVSQPAQSRRVLQCRAVDTDKPAARADQLPTNHTKGTKPEYHFPTEYTDGTESLGFYSVFSVYSVGNILY